MPSRAGHVWKGLEVSGESWASEARSPIFLAGAAKASRDMS